MKIEIFTDFACPFCYIGKKRLEQAIIELGMEKDVIIEYKAYQLDSNASKEVSVPLMKDGTSSDRFEAILAHAKEVGLTYHLEKVLVGNTENAHRLAKWTKTKNLEGAFIEETLYRYFTQGLDVNDNEELLAIVAQIGLSVKEAETVLNRTDAFQEELASDRYDIQQIPVTSIPFFVFENRYGIKGVEPIEVFTKTLTQTANYLNKQSKLQMNGYSGTSCSIDGCE